LERPVFGILESITNNEHAGELLELIKSGKYLLIGGQALAAYLEPRFTADYDFLVDSEAVEKIKSWLEAKTVSYSDIGYGCLRVENYSIDILDAGKNEINSRVLKADSRQFEGFEVPAPEGLAALKFLSMMSRPSQSEQLIDIADFIALVKLPEFSEFTLTSFYRDTEMIEKLVKVLDAIKKEKPASKILTILEQN
jgi:hypothetical protein